MESSFLDIDTPSAEELTWLQASIILDEDAPPTPPPKDDDVFMKDILFHSRLPLNRLPARSASPATTGCSHVRSSSVVSSGMSHSTTSKRLAASAASTPPRSEWIYRTLKTPPSARSANSTPYPKVHSRPTSKYHARSASASVPRSQSDDNVRTCQTLSEDGHSVNASGSSTAPFWSNVLHPRSRSVRSIPLLKTIPSQSQIVFTPPSIAETVVPTSTPFTPPRRSSSSACSSRSMAHHRPPSVSSTLDSTSSTNSPSSSRSESPAPVTPVSRSPSLCGAAPNPRSQYHYVRPRRHQTQTDSPSSLNPTASSCPPSKSILTRTSSSSTSHTTNKSVKFAAPVVHYGNKKSYWDIESIADNSSMGININSMDVDDDPFANHGSREKQSLSDDEFGSPRRAGQSFDLSDLRQLHSTTTPTSHRGKPKSLKRFISWKPTLPATTITTMITANATPLTPPASPTPSHKSFSINSRTPTTPPRRAPSISNPYALGAFPPPQPNFFATQSTTSLPGRPWPPSPPPPFPSSLRRNFGNDSRSPHQHHNNTPAGSVSISHPLTALAPGSLVIPIRTAPSCESFRSTKSTAARSVRSMGSAKSSMSTRGLKAWFNRRIGWTDPVN